MTGAGKISGSSAVSFLTKSGLPLPALKSIWSLSDTSGSHALEKSQFNVALRYIQIVQAVVAQTGSLQNVRITQDLLKAHSQKELGLPTFDGVDIGTAKGPSTVAVEASSAPAVASNGVTSDQYAMTASERERYDTLFPAYSTNNDGFIYGSEAVALFSKSGLDRQALRQIWNLSDEPVDNRLSKVEFAIAMHLIVCVSKKNLPIPPTLPSSLANLRAPSSNSSFDGLAAGTSAMTQVSMGLALSSPAPVSNQAKLQPPSEEKPKQNLSSIGDAFSDNMLKASEPTNAPMPSLSYAGGGMGMKADVSAPPVSAPAPIAAPMAVPALSVASAAVPAASSVATASQDVTAMRNLITKLQAEKVSLTAKLESTAKESEGVGSELR